MIPFRTLCSKLRAAIKAAPAGELSSFGNSPVRAVAGLRINASDFLRLCGRLQIDPLTGERGPMAHDPGPLCSQMVGAGCALQRHLKKLSMRAAADEIGVSASTLHRLEQNLPVSIESILAVCAFIGVHPFNYMQNEKRRAA